MRTWNVIFVPVWRIGEVLSAVSGWERMVTRGTKEFQSGHVDVFVRAAQTRAEGAEMVVELPMWRVALVAAMVGVERVEFVGSVSSAMAEV